MLPKPRNKKIESVKVGDESLTIPEICCLYNVAETTFRNRRKRGWTVDQALGLADPPSRATQIYIVTFPNGEEEQVSNFPKFAKKHKLPRNGRELQALATRTRKNYSWYGWGCRIA